MSPEQLKMYIEQKKRGWSKFLYQLIEPKIAAGYTARQISDWLSGEHQIIYSARNVRSVIDRQYRLIKKTNESYRTVNCSRQASEKKTQNTQNKIGQKRVYTQLSLEEQLEVNKSLAAQQAEFSASLAKKSTLKKVQRWSK